MDNCKRPFPSDSCYAKLCLVSDGYEERGNKRPFQSMSAGAHMRSLLLHHLIVHADFARLENMPQTMITMMVAGLTYPLATAALGIGWLAFRIIYAYGYITADTPKGRQAGGGFWLMQGGIWGIAAYTGLKML